MTFRNLSLLFVFSAGIARADVTPTAPPGAAASSTGTNSAPVTLDPVVVTGQLDLARQQILPELGATSYLIGQQQIQDISQGADAPFNQVLLRAPGVAEDSAPNGDLHVRGEHANLQYRINDVLLPEGISGFGLELDSRFVDSLQLITGSLPAQYGFRTAGIVDIKTKSGLLEPGGDVSFYGGSYDTFRPSVETGGASGNLSAYVDASYDHNDLGIENPTPNASAIHDQTDQSKAFAYVSDILDSTSRISFIGSASYSNFQVPDTAGLPAGTSPDGNPWLPGTFDSAKLNENQNEQNYYGVVAYQKSAGDLNYQISGFGRASSVHFTPDPTGDLYFNGVSSNVQRKLGSVGFQGDASYALAEAHTVRGGLFLLNESATADSTTTVFPVNDDGDPTGPAFPITDNHQLYGLFAGLYVQDEWKLTPQLTLNYGARFDLFNASFDDEHQLSPRVNLVYQPSSSTTLHAGYARYFTPPPVENVSGGTLAKFDGTSNAAPTDQDDPVKAERSNYFDAGIGQKIAPGFQVGIDGYYKQAKNQLDDGLFGQTLILSAFNYAQGEVYGVELTTSYTHGGFSAYGNLARSDAKGKNWDSAQFLFDPVDLAYVQNHWIHLDHDQRLSGSFGSAYKWTETQGSTRLYVDVIYGTGLRTDATAADGSNIPNGGSVPSYVTFNVGAEQSFKLGSSHDLKLRLDVVNLADKSYELRDGTGVGVNAAQYGERRGFFGSVSYTF
jgi:outer membrane receptor protein involved in Fe transport